MTAPEPANPEALGSALPLRRPLREVVTYFLRLGTLGFGGPVALVGLMENELVQERQWLTRDEMRNAVAVSQSLPGPLAIQGRHFYRLSAGRLLGRMGRWMGLYSAQLSDRGRARDALRPFRRALLDDGGLLSREPCGDRANSSFLLPPGKARYGGLVAMGDCGRLLCHYSLARGRSRDSVHRLQGRRDPYYGSFVRGRKPPTGALMALAPLGIGTKAASFDILGRLLAFFLKAGSLTFGSGLVIVPFLEKGLVQQTGWVNGREFLIAVAVGMISPGPVVITATFVGYLVAGFWGSLVSTVGIFLPSFLLILIIAPILVRHRDNSNVQGFVKGAYAAAIGTILGACVLLSKIAIGDWLTALIGLGSLAVLFRYKVSNPLLMAATAVLGLIAFPLPQPSWVFVK